MVFTPSNAIDALINRLYARDTLRCMRVHVNKRDTPLGSAATQWRIQGGSLGAMDPPFPG